MRHALMQPSAPKIQALEAALTGEWVGGIELCRRANLGKSLVPDLYRIAQNRGWQYRLSKENGRLQYQFRIAEVAA